MKKNEWLDVVGCVCEWLDANGIRYYSPAYMYNAKRSSYYPDIIVFLDNNRICGIDVFTTQSDIFDVRTSKVRYRKSEMMKDRLRVKETFERLGIEVFFVDDIFDLENVLKLKNIKLWKSQEKLKK
ncbi:MAG: hypothetical protein QW051_03740 [Candidatus Aenigmatarchaeota archaeon]